jgi:TonB family protein
MLLFLAHAVAADLPALAEKEGLDAVLTELRSMEATTKPKKLRAALVAARLSDVSMPVRAHLGADLTLKPGPASGCTYGPAITCRFEASVQAPVQADDFQVTCRSRLGMTVPVPVRLVTSSATTAVFEVGDLTACWEVGEHLLVHPTASDALEGVGMGDEEHFIPPEITALHKTQVERTLGESLPMFRMCTRKSERRLSGKVVVAYHIADDGQVDEASIASSSLGDDAVEACLVERMLRFRFPAVNDGYDGGTYPFTFQ